MLIEQVAHRRNVLGQLCFVTFDIGTFDIGDQVLGQQLLDTVGATDRAHTTENNCGLGSG